MPTPIPFKSVIKVPNATNPSKINGQTQSIAKAITIVITVEAIATKRLPLKKAKKSGSLIHPKPLKHVAPIKPDKIPIKGFAMLLNARVSISVSVTSFEAESTFKIVVKTSHETRAATPAVPSFFLAIPTPTPIANNIPILLISAPPAVVKNKPMV